jgi:REP element-mobilizing transposase RayT
MSRVADAPNATRRYRGPIARLPRSALPSSGIYHVTARGVARCSIFHDDSDRRRFLERLRRIAGELRWTCFLYCLMTTHYHLLVGSDLDQLSKGMQRLQAPYAQQFNARYGRVGHLFQERFHTRVIRDELHFAHAYEYIQNNPVAAGMCETAADWPWSGRI